MQYTDKKKNLANICEPLTPEINHALRDQLNNRAIAFKKQFYQFGYQ